ncbi:hypothetical protein VC279_14740 [Xanthomonas sp. WHRI 10064A]|uniref:hypothetical protein n=1 Tax=unclassified Xanthomonas TaxID=2643310 RepID=UPI002B22A5CA|nr:MULTISPECIES: hypothetical protein [unclassified Xanthomonas]MEA9586732.1 hypothetical protein [Xanthomonas sp. WHRI 10064B]MEA9615923.1 hypothetical protein [Xanthomonas sp. WHRI 10064A]
MSTLFERFIAGEDGLAALLRALPAYAPPDRMQAWFAQAAAQADSTRNTAGPGSAQTTSADAADTLQFEPPATMGAIFAAAAVQAEQAQAAQRAAIHARLADGDDAAQALGAPVHDSTRAWLQQQLPVASTATHAAAPALRENDSDDAPVGDGTAPVEATQTASRSSSSVAPGDTSPAPVPVAATPPITSHEAQTGDKAQANDATRAHPPTRRARRQRWMPALALAASVTLAVGVGLQWQATAPPTPSMQAAPAAAMPADQAQAAEKLTRSAPDNQAPLPQIPQPEPAPAPASTSASASASASADFDSTVEERMHQPAYAPPPAFAPPPMPAPAQPVESLVVVPTPPAPAAAPSEPAPIAAAPAADLALPALPAPVAPSVSASVAEMPSPSANRNAAVPDTAIAAQARVRSKPKPAAAPAFAAATPANDMQPFGQLDAGNSAHSTPAAAVVSRAPQDTQLSRALIKRAPLQKDAATQQRVQEHTAAQAPGPVSTVAAPQASTADDAARSSEPVHLLALTTSPDTWLDHALPAGQRGPVQLHIWTADPEANAFRQWLDQLRKAYSKRNVPAQLDIARDPRLPTDRVRVETVSPTQPK